MKILSYEHDDDNVDGFRLFVDAKLLPYSDLLMLKNSKILANAKSRLPFYYTLPVISWIMSLFSGRSKEKKRATTSVVVEKNPFEEEEKKSDSAPKQTKTQARASNA
jgi:hypothetical protein